MKRKIVVAPMVALLALALYVGNTRAESSYDSFITTDSTVCYEPRPLGENRVALIQWGKPLAYGHQVTVHTLIRAPWSTKSWTLVDIGNSETCLVRPSSVFPLVHELPKVGVNPDTSDEPVWGSPLFLALGGFLIFAGFFVMCCIAGYKEHSDEIRPRLAHGLRTMAKIAIWPFAKFALILLGAYVYYTEHH